MKPLLSWPYAPFGSMTASASAFPQIADESLNKHWSEGAEDCKAHPQAPLEVRMPSTYRHSSCERIFAPLLKRSSHVSARRSNQGAVLIDTGDVADPKLMPLAETVIHPAAWGRTFKASPAHGSAYSPPS